jgi:4'-phosphopantetheinyl transferase
MMSLAQSTGWDLPLPRERSCVVYFASLRAYNAGLTAWLTVDELARTSRCYTGLEFQLSVLGKVLVRFLAAAVLGIDPMRVPVRLLCHCGSSQHGRPYIDSDVLLDYSVAHSGDQLVLALSRGDYDSRGMGSRVGIDIELRSALCLDALDAVCSPYERRNLVSLVDARELVKVWTRKEALLKSSGHGLSIAPAEISLTKPTQPPRVLARPSRFSTSRPINMQDLPAPSGYVCSIAQLGDELPVTSCTALAFPA